MLKTRRFNVVLVKEGTELILDNPAGKLVEYNGKALTVKM